MAEIKNNYVSKYSGDQLDAAIAALGSLDKLFITTLQFTEFKNQFDSKMGEFSTQITNALPIKYELITDETKSNNG